MVNSAIQPQQIFPSLLAANPLKLEEEISSLISMGIQTIHLDVMDNHYVPNLTFGPHIAARIKECFPELILDVHLMTSPVDSLIDPFIKAGASRISIHPDATVHLDRSLSLIRAQNCLAGLVFNPSTTIDVLEWCAHKLDFVLVMTVNPGFGGQSFIPEMLTKISQIHEKYPHLTIAVDGGVGISNIQALAKAGASEFIIGSALFPNCSDTLKKLCC